RPGDARVVSAGGARAGGRDHPGQTPEDPGPRGRPKTLRAPHSQSDFPAPGPRRSSPPVPSLQPPIAREAPDHFMTWLQRAGAGNSVPMIRMLAKIGARRLAEMITSGDGHPDGKAYRDRSHPKHDEVVARVLRLHEMAQ